MRSAGSASSCLVAGDPEEDDATALADEPRRELDGRHGAGGLDDDVEPAADEPPRLLLGVARATLTTASAPSAVRELELLVAQPVGDDRRRGAKSRDADGERAHRADADDADGLGRLDARAAERLHDARAGLDERGGLERDVVGERVEDARRHDDELAPASAAREADRVVALAEVRVARTAARAAHAADVPLAHDALARLDAGHALADRVDDAAPLVARARPESAPSACRARPVTMSMSVRQTPATTLRTRTSPGPGVGVSTSRRRRRSAARSTIARMAERAYRCQDGARDARAGTRGRRASSSRSASAPVSVYVADDHGEIVAAATMDGAAPDTRLNAQRKAYTAARSDATLDGRARREGARGRGRARELRPVLHVLPGRRRRVRGRPPGRRGRRERPSGPGRRRARATGDRRGGSSTG